LLFKVSYWLAVTASRKFSRKEFEFLFRVNSYAIPSVDKVQQVLNESMHDIQRCLAIALWRASFFYSWLSKYTFPYWSSLTDTHCDSTVILRLATWNTSLANGVISGLYIVIWLVLSWVR